MFSLDYLKTNYTWSPYTTNFMNSLGGQAIYLSYLAPPDSGLHFGVAGWRSVD